MDPGEGASAMPASYEATDADHLVPLKNKKDVSSFLLSILGAFLEEADIERSGLRKELSNCGILTSADQDSFNDLYPTRRDKASHLWIIMYSIDDRVFVHEVLPLLCRHYHHIIPAKFWRKGVITTAGPSYHTTDREDETCYRCAVQKRIPANSIALFLFTARMIDFETYSQICHEYTSGTTDWSRIFKFFQSASKNKITRHADRMGQLLQANSLKVPRNPADIMRTGFPCTCHKKKLACFPGAACWSAHSSHSSIYSSHHSLQDVSTIPGKDSASPSGHARARQDSSKINSSNYSANHSSLTYSDSKFASRSSSDYSLSRNPHMRASARSVQYNSSHPSSTDSLQYIPIQPASTGSLQYVPSQCASADSLQHIPRQCGSNHSHQFNPSLPASTDSLQYIPIQPASTHNPQFIPSNSASTGNLQYMPRQPSSAHSLQYNSSQPSSTHSLQYNPGQPASTHSLQYKPNQPASTQIPQYIPSQPSSTHSLQYNPSLSSSADSLQYNPSQPVSTQTPQYIPSQPASPQPPQYMPSQPVSTHSLQYIPRQHASTQIPEDSPRPPAPSRSVSSYQLHDQHSITSSNQSSSDDGNGLDWRRPLKVIGQFLLCKTSELVSSSSPSTMLLGALLDYLTSAREE